LRHPISNYFSIFIFFSKTALLIWYAENCDFIQILFCTSHEGFNIASHVTSQIWYLRGIQIWTVTGWLLCLLNHLRTILVLIGIVERRAMHVSCWIYRSVWQQLVHNELWKQKLKTSVTVCTNKTAKISSRQRDCTDMVRKSRFCWVGTVWRC